MEPESPIEICRARQSHMDKEPFKSRPVTLFTGRWAELPFTEVCELAAPPTHWRGSAP